MMKVILKTEFVCKPSISYKKMMELNPFVQLLMMYFCAAKIIYINYDIDTAISMVSKIK